MFPKKVRIKIYVFPIQKHVCLPKKTTILTLILIFK